MPTVNLSAAIIKKPKKNANSGARKNKKRRYAREQFLDVKTDHRAGRMR